MRRVAVIAASLLAGAVVGAVLMLAAQGITSEDEPAGVDAVPGPTRTSPEATEQTASTDQPTTTAPPPLTTTAPPVPSPPLSDQVLLAWTPGSLPDGFAQQVETLAGVTAVTSVRSNLVHLVETRNTVGDTVDRPPDGFVIPIEVIAYDPANYPAFLPKQHAVTFTELQPGQVILGAASAELRRLRPGGVLVLEDGTQLTVAAVVDDVLIGAAEAALPVEQAKPSGVAAERYLLIRYTGQRKTLEESIRGRLPEGVPVRIRAPGETPVLRHGDAVLPQVLIKQKFGEFAYRPGNQLRFDIEPGWADANLATAEVPILGTVTCHRNLLPALRGALEEIEQRGLAHLIEPDGYRGCYNPRYIAGRKGISRHAWGAAIDINIGTNPQGLESIQDPRLIEIMERWGLTSGHQWLIPDPGHFEYIRPPT